MRLLLMISVLWAQDTLRVLAYNLLNYGNTPGYCDTRCKDQQLRVIVNHVRPALIGFNEIAPYAGYVRRILDSVLNVGGVTWWRSGVFANVANGDRISMVFYDERRFGWLGQTLVTTQGGLRDVYAYHLYYKDRTLATHQDTLFVTVIVSHLKAGNTTSDATTRAQAATAIRNYIQSLPAPKQAFVLDLGDHNLHGASEAAYQRLVEVLVDPGPTGEWDNNPTYATYHTQSTRVQSLADGGSSGGLDSRFDFIFFSPACTTNSAKARYVPNSYKALGQDGLHYERNITDAPPAAGLPQSVLNALYALSDHLPVYADFALAIPSALTSLAQAQTHAPFFVVQGGTQITLEATEIAYFEILTIQGERLWAGTLAAGEGQTLNPAPGLYLIRAYQGGQSITTKTVVLP